MIKVIFLIFVIFFIGLKTSGQNNFCIVRGKIIDKHTNKPVGKAEVVFSIIDKQVYTPSNGQFSLAIPANKYIVQIYHNEYKKSETLIDISKDTTIIFYIEPLINSILIDEVIITAKQNKIEQTLLGIDLIESASVKKIPSIAGEKDLLKSLSYLPGVTSSGEGAADIQVRGGSSDQNLYLIDNAVMYNSSHIFGFISSFNPSIINTLSLYKAAFPAKYGGRLSAIVETQTKDIDYNKFHFDTEVGIISAKASIQIPVIRGKSALLISSRRTYFDLYAKASSKNNFNSFNFFDGFIKYSHRINDKNKIDFYAYSDRDRIFNYEKMRPNRIKKKNIDFKNKIFAVNYKTNLSDKVSNMITLSYSGYSMDINQLEENEDTLVDNMILRSYISDISLKNNLSINFSSKLKSNFGFLYTLYQVSPADVKYKTYNQEQNRSLFPTTKAIDWALHADAEYLFSKSLAFYFGLRNSWYQVQSKFYYRLEPRLAINYKINPNNAIKASYSSMAQPLHLIANEGLGMPVSIWFSSDIVLKPQLSEQIAIAFNRNITVNNQRFSFGFDTYYKTMKNIPSYADGYSFDYYLEAFYSHEIIDLNRVMTIGNGKSYGFEWSLSKNTGKFNFQAAYTISWIVHQFDNLNMGKAFYAKNDRRHNFSFAMGYQFSKQFEIGLSWVYYSGQPVTLPTDTYFFPGFLPQDTYQTGNLNVPLYSQSERNQYRMKAMHRLDLSAKWNFLLGKKNKFKSSLSCDIYNVYNRKNPYYYYVDKEYTSNEQVLNQKIELKSVSLFPIIPSVTFGISF